MLRCCWENEGTERALGQKSAPMRASPRLAALIGGGPGCFRLNRENLASTPMRDCPRLSTPERMCIHLMVCPRPSRRRLVAVVMGAVVGCLFGNTAGGSAGEVEEEKGQHRFITTNVRDRSWKSPRARPWTGSRERKRGNEKCLLAPLLPKHTNALYRS